MTSSVEPEVSNLSRSQLGMIERQLMTRTENLVNLGLAVSELCVRTHRLMYRRTRLLQYSGGEVTKTTKLSHN